MAIKPRLPSALRAELGVKEKDRRRDKKEDRAPRKKRKLYQPQVDAIEPREHASRTRNNDESSRREYKKTNDESRRREYMPRTTEDVLMEQDDAEIDYWEAKLGRGGLEDEMNDGLDDIFDGLSLPRGKSRLEEISDVGESPSEDEVPQLVNKHQAADFTQFEEEEEEEEESGVESVEKTTSKSSIYLPYAESVSEKTTSAGAATAYVPPALRKKLATSDATPLKRQLKGLLNRLSAANISTIVNEIEAMYRTNPRGSMNDELASLLLEIVSDKSGLLDSFVVLHAALIAALYKSTGIEFAAALVQSLVATMIDLVGAQMTTGRKAINLMALLAELYNFNIIAATLPYDFIRLLVGNLNELNIEMLLVLVKSSGSELRSDDPSALKDILILLQDQMKTQYTDKEVPLRMQYMVDTMMSLKNNKVANAAGQQTKDLRTRMKKYLGGLTTRAGSSSGEPIRVSLEDIRHVETRGKWWLVGASWRNQDTIKAPSGPQGDQGAFKDEHESRSFMDENKEQELLALAKQHRLNNPIRKQIFVTILSATDYLEAITGVLSLRLKKSQESEIARVLILLVASEEHYNPYYTHIAKGLSERHGMRISLQFCLWDFLRDCGETEVGQIGGRGDDDDEDGVRKPSLRKAVNVAKFFGTLMAWQVLPITVLKTLTFSRLQSLTKRFLEVLMTEVFITLSEKDTELADLFSRCKKFDKENKNTALRDGIDWFLRKVVGKCAVVTEEEERAAVKTGVEIARMVLSS